MARGLNISSKLALIMIGFAVVVTAFLSASFYLQFENALRERVLLQLSSVKQLKMVKSEAEIQDRIRLFNAFAGEEREIQEPSSPFVHISAYEQIPDNIQGYDLPGDLTVTDQTRLIDLTLQSEDQVITIGFTKSINGEYWLAIARIPEIQAILLERTGLGETGESYIVGNDYRFRTKSRFRFAENEDIKVKTKGVMRALRDEPGEDNFLDYRGVEVFSSYEKIAFPGLTWIMMSEINAQEALTPLRKLRTNLIFIVMVILLFILIVSFYLSRMLVSPLISMEKKLIRMSKGVQEGVMTKVDRKDEIGHMFQALNKLVLALDDTIKFAGKIGEGNFHAQFQPLSKKDKLGDALIRMKDKLQTYQKNEIRLLRQNQQSILNGEEKERARLSKELHDGLGPMLTTLRIDIQAADLEEHSKSSLIQRIDHTIREVRFMSYNLMPSVLRDFGAGEAIGNLIEQIRQNSPVEILYKNDMLPESKIDDTIQIALYRIAQEALNNALKHSGATKIGISLTVFDDYVSLFVGDNGCGFDPKAKTHGNGIRNMHERAKLVGGSIAIESNEKGTTIEAEIPIR